MKNGFIKDFLLTGFGNILVIVFGFLNSIIITRWLGPQDKGLYTLVMNIVIFLNLLLGEGVRRSNTIIIAQNKYYLKKLLLTNLLYFFLILFINVLIFSLSSIISVFIKNLSSQLLIIALFISLFGIMWQAVQAVYLGLKNYFYFNILLVTSTFITLIFNILGIAFFNIQLKEILIIILLSNSIVFFWGVIILLRFSNSKSLNQDFNFSSQIQLSIKSTITNLEVFVFLRSSIFILNNLVDSTAVGIFSVAFLFSDMIQRIPNVAGTLIFSNVANEEKSHSIQTAKVARTVIFILFIFVLLIVVCGKFVILFLFGEQFRDAIYPLSAMSIGLIFFGAGSIFHSYYMGKKYPVKMIKLNFYVSLLAVILNFYFITSFSILGAGIAYSLILTTWGSAYLFMFSRETKIPLVELVFIKKDDLKEIVHKNLSKSHFFSK